MTLIQGSERKHLRSNSCNPLLCNHGQEFCPDRFVIIVVVSMGAIVSLSCEAVCELEQFRAIGLARSSTGLVQSV